MKKKNYTFIDLFAGAGGLSEGFVRAGFSPIAHIEMDKYACETLKTRAAYHYLEENDKLDIYKKYLLEKKDDESGQKLWSQVPATIIDSVIHATIGPSTIDDIFHIVDNLKGKNSIDLIIGGPLARLILLLEGQGWEKMSRKILETNCINTMFAFWKDTLPRCLSLRMYLV